MDIDLDLDLEKTSPNNNLKKIRREKKQKLESIGVKPYGENESIFSPTYNNISQ